MSIPSLIPFDAPAHRAVDDPAFTKINVPDRECATHLLNEAPEQYEHVVLGLADQLEAVAGGKIAAKLEGIQGDRVAQQADLEVELVRLSTAVRHPDGIEPDTLEIGEAG
ncbi:hypothetical protein M3I53_36630 [Paraburkholderia sp. CNPSo 3272]|uniref:hypothetical protein n=1 Tax=Paraburkholderia sp. CNPSo 3272 TaxID=2940931 RepID=UPI0020B87E35|nr:hypothetical protein [Paraburkholderia sp. CNPSo 3272]MCP3728552.1 hypothetical protein [Paraburkholderia sp. CNPSo 3272]